MAAKPTISYRISFPQPHTHYMKIEMEVKQAPAGTNLVKMAVWTPGSYLIREYAKNVEQVKATDSKGNELPVSKSSKNSFEVKNGKETGFKIEYQVYAFELTVRNAFVDDEMAYFNPAAVLPWLNGFHNEPSTLTITPWKKDQLITTGLKPVKASNPWELSAGNLDELFDCPVQIGSHTVWEFEAEGVPHQIAMVGSNTADSNKLIADIKKIVKAAKGIFGELPCKDYTFIVHHMNNGSGGLEHGNSTTLQATPNTYSTPAGLEKFLGLVSHEYFHLWNVKRLRPKALGPFDYENENYTPFLWFSEGFTAYYDDYILYKAGLITKERYLEILSSNFGYVQNSAGARIQSLAESSHDAWIKYYRPNENSGNATANYYTHGAAIATLLHWEILKASQGKKDLDGFMKSLYETFYKKKDAGFNYDEFYAHLNSYAGKDLASSVKVWTEKPMVPDFEKLAGEAGIKFKNLNENKKDAWIGVNTSAVSGRLIISSIQRNSPAWNGKLSVNDELIAINGIRVPADPSAVQPLLQLGEPAQILISRGGEIKSLIITPYKNPAVSWKAEEIESGKEVREAWLRR